MNKQYLKENNLYNAHKQFMRLCEWSYVPSNLEEDDDDDQDPNAMGGGAPMGGQDPNAMGGDMPMDGQDPNAMGGGAPMNGQDPNAMGGDMPMDGQDPNAMGGDMPMDGQDPNAMGDDMPMDGQDPNAMMGDEDMPMDDGEEDDVIDVDDITNAQEKMNDKVNIVGQDLGQVDDKITSLMKALSNMETMINKNNDEIAQFKQEFEKRNPTQTEKLNLRSLDSYPFNVSPKDYWEKKGIDPNSNYSGYSNNEIPTKDDNLEITNSDVDDFSDRDIEDSFDISDDLNQDIKKIFGL